MARLLIVDEEASLCRMLEIVFGKEGLLVEAVSSGQAAKERIKSQAYDLIISDIRGLDLNGFELLEFVRSTHYPAIFIFMTAVPTIMTAVEALNMGAYRYVIKTDQLLDELKLTVRGALEELALREENQRLRLAHLPGSATGLAATGQQDIQIPPEGLELESYVAQVEKQYLQAALRAARGDSHKAAGLLKMSYRTFSRYAKKYGI